MKFGTAAAGLGVAGAGGVVLNNALTAGTATLSTAGTAVSNAALAISTQVSSIMGSITGGLTAVGNALGGATGSTTGATVAGTSIGAGSAILGAGTGALAGAYTWSKTKDIIKTIGSTATIGGLFAMQPHIVGAGLATYGLKMFYDGAMDKGG